MKSSGTQSDTSGGGGGMATAKGILILVLLMVLAGAGGYFFGTYQKFAPIQNVPAGTPGAIEQASSGESSSPSPPGAQSSLKKKYWLKSDGYEHIGYAVSVYVNGQLADKIFAPDKKKEITHLVKPGENQINFQANVLPDGMREHKGDSSYWMSVGVYSGDAVGQDRPDELLEYKRNANEFQDFNDTMSFVTME